MADDQWNGDFMPPFKEPPRENSNSFRRKNMRHGNGSLVVRIDKLERERGDDGGGEITGEINP